jgi:hypothetical protein
MDRPYPEISRDEALLWLNDRSGRDVHVAVSASAGDDFGPMVMWAAGALRHQSNSGLELRLPAYRVARDDLAGWYRVGDAHVDLTDLGDRYEIRDLGDELHVSLLRRGGGSENHVWLSITVQAESREEAAR